MDIGYFAIIIIAFILGYAAGWDGHKTNQEIEKRKQENPDGWWKE